MNVSYEVWHRVNLIFDGGDYPTALAFVRRQVEVVDAAALAAEIATFSLMRVTSPEDCEVVATGAQLLALLG